MPAFSPFPLFLQLACRGVLVVGAGENALRKVRLLLGSGCLPRVVTHGAAPEPELRDLAAAGRIRLERRAFRPEDLAGQTLVFAAVEDEAEAAAVSAAARAAGIPVNAPDRPALSTFYMPALVERAPITVAIASEGASPLLARRLRAQIEALLPANLGRFATFLGRVRQGLKGTSRDVAARRRFLERLAEGPIAERFLAGDEAGAEAAADRALAAPDEAPRGSVALVGAGPGDPDLLTLRALRLLQEAEVLVHDALVDERVLDYVRRDARRIYVGKRKARHTLTQAEINRLLVSEARAGHRVVRLKGGDPFIFGRGGEELEALRAAGVAVEIVPGLTAALGCGAAATIPMTHRDLAGGVTFLSGHGKDGEPELDWEALARLKHTLAIYMGLGTLGRVAQRLIAGGLDRATPAAVIEKGTRPDQRVVVGTLESLPRLAAAKGLTGPALVVVGRVVDLADPALIESELEAAQQRLAS